MAQDGYMRYDATTANAVEASGLFKRFGKTTALAGVDLVAREGQVLGVLGPNGAGKTTAVRILATLLRPDSGPPGEQDKQDTQLAPANVDGVPRPVADLKRAKQPDTQR